MAGVTQTPERKRAEARRLRGEGRTWGEIATLTGLSDSTVRRACGAVATPGSRKRSPPVRPAGEAATRRADGATATGDRDPIPDTLLGALEGELAYAIRARRKSKTPAEAEKWSKRVQALVGGVEKLRPDPEPTREELEAKHKPRADEVVAKVRNGIVAVARREAETGRCLRCAQGLSQETVLRRRIEAGMVDPPPMH